MERKGIVMSRTDDPGRPQQGADAYRTLIAEIDSGALKPGDRLVETELAARLGRSRTPIREAIRQLEADGMVTHVPRIGAVIRTLDYSEITELYEMRTVLEGTAARFAARAASEIDLGEIRSINEEMRASTDIGVLLTANRQFHAVLLNAARNRFLVRSVEAIQKTLLILGPSTMEEAGRASTAIEEHDRIIAALEARDPAAAEAAMRVHIQNAQRARLRQIRLEDVA
ncbi:HTH-type transcriptional regulator LutR [Roseisalinus antarcticus]|uniref:HTH-type transcriptional regulator LutR n=2 Tax=Roseisalinus antarcticus TaxID=254357 RepID=A0A1Y5T6E6_9RHOB|nr:HTH-type transcriptional regulator LutR [Roseisalinus antarcticus]